MKRTRFRLWWLIPLSFVLVPPLLWMILLLVIPTDWARARFERAVSQATGRSVHLESLRIGVLGGVRLTNLEIGAPGSAKDPWLKVADARLNVTLLQLLFGPARPTDAQVDGISLRVLRRADGTVELADLIPTAPNSATSARATTDPGETHCALGGIEVQIHQCQVCRRRRGGARSGSARWTATATATYRRASSSARPSSSAGSTPTATA